MAARLPGQQRGGVAHVQPFADTAPPPTYGSAPPPSRASWSSVTCAIGLIGGEQMRHHAFQPQRRSAAKARQHGPSAQAPRPVGSSPCRSPDAPAICPASPHAALPNSSSCQGSQATTVSRCSTARALAAKHAADHQNLAHRGKARAPPRLLPRWSRPATARPRTHHRRRADSSDARSIGLHNRQQLRMRPGQFQQESIVVFKSLGANLHPAGTS